MAAAWSGGEAEEIAGAIVMWKDAKHAVQTLRTSSAPEHHHLKCSCCCPWAPFPPTTKPGEGVVFADAHTPQSRP